MKTMIVMILRMITIIIVITIAIMIMMVKAKEAVVIITNPFQPGDFFTGSTTEHSKHNFLEIPKNRIKPLIQSYV